MPDTRLRKLLAEALRAPEGNTNKHAYEKMMANGQNYRGPDLPVRQPLPAPTGNPMQQAMPLGRVPARHLDIPMPSSEDGDYSKAQIKAEMDPIIGKEREAYQKQMMLAELEEALAGRIPVR
jgi:hypothetical protein